MPAPANSSCQCLANLVCYMASILISSNFRFGTVPCRTPKRGNQPDFFRPLLAHRFPNQFFPQLNPDAIHMPYICHTYAIHMPYILSANRWLSRSCSNCHAGSAMPPSSVSAAISSSSGLPLPEQRIKTENTASEQHFRVSLQPSFTPMLGEIYDMIQIRWPKTWSKNKKNRLSHHHRPGSAAEGCKLFTSGSKISSYSNKPGAIS